MSIFDGRNEFGMRQDDFEGLKLYYPDSRINDAVGKKVKSIFEKLFKNMGVNSDDFLFMCFHEEDPNAFFINKNTGTGQLSKNVIAVSDSMIQHLDHEEELAAVIAHECGHFVWQQYTQDDNTIVQERWSDIQSVDLMINAGYNPLYILEMQKKVFPNFTYNSVDFGVHGTGFARAEDVKAYLTKKSMERGDFKNIKQNKSKNWADYQKSIEKIYQEDGYNTYLDKLLIDTFGTKDLTKINRVEFLKLILDTVNSYKISGLTKVRINDLARKLQDYNLKIKTEQETHLLQEIFLSLNKTADTKSVYPVLYQSYLDFFGPFQEQYENIKNLMKSANNRDDAIMYAKKILDLKWTKDYTGAFVNRYPQFTADGPDNIGKPLIFEQLYSYDNSDINNVLYLLQEYYYCKSDYSPFDYYLKNGVVILYGEDARKQHEKDKENALRKQDEQKLQNNTKTVHQCIDYLNKMSDYATGKISAADIIENLQWFESPYMVSFSYDVYIPEMKQLQATLLQSRGFDYFVRGNDNPVDNINFQGGDFSEINTYIEKISTFHHNDTFRARYYDTMFKLAKDLIKENKMSISIMGRYYDKIINYRSRKLEKQYAIFLLHLFSTTPYFLANPVPLLISENLQYNERSICLENIIKQVLGKNKIETSDELLKVIKFINIYTPNNNNNYNILMWVEFLRYGGRADPIKVIEALKPQNLDWNLDRDIISSISNILAEFIPDQDFNSMTLYDQISLYEYLERNDLFSDKHANQNKYIKTIVDQIVSCPITDDNAVEYAKQLLTRNPITRYGNYKNSDIQFFNEREKLIEFYSDMLAHKLGRDDGSDEYTQRVHNFVKELEVPVHPNLNTFSDAIKKSILDKVSNKVVSQEKAAKAMGTATTIDVTKLAKHDKALRVAEAAFAALAYKQNAVIKMINFLSNKLTEKSLDDTLNFFSTDKLTGQNPINKTNLILIHENFWGADLPIRAYLMNRLLNSYSNDDKDKLKLVIDMYFDEKSDYRKDAELVINAVYNNLQEYERNLIIAALASAGQKGESDNISGGRMVGRGLKMFLQNKGPAFIKFGQLLSYLPTLDSDIRSELATLRDNANIPTRNELFDIIKTALPESEMKKISYVGNLLGAGSFYITVKVIYNGQPCVLSVMRPFTHDLTQSGIDMIARTIDELVASDKKYYPLKNILNQARESALSEIDIEQDYKKYKNAKSMYEKFQVTTGDTTYTPDVAQWLTYGASDDGVNAYKIMEMADGHSLSYDKWTTQEKHTFAVAYVTLELALLLSGQKWDTDRHQGQQNFYNSDFRNFCIGIFDTGAQMNKTPTTTDKIMLGHLMYELAVNAKRGKGIGDTLIKIIKNLDNTAKKIDIDTAYIDGVQRGLTALSDIIEYQKEQKDEYGNIIQESKCLTNTDFENIIAAIYDSGVIDNVVKKTVITKAILYKLLLWKSGLKLRHGTSDDTDDVSPAVVLKYDNIDPTVNTATKISKAQSEIEAILSAKKNQLPIGMRENKDTITSSFTLA